MMEVIPFTAPGQMRGLIESKGLLRLEDLELVLEFQSKDSILGIIKSEVMEVRLPLAEIAEVVYDKPFYAWAPSLIIRGRSMSLLSEIPGSDMGAVSLQCARKDRAALKRLVSTVSMMISELEMHRLGQDVRKLGGG